MRMKSNIRRAMEADLENDHRERQAQIEELRTNPLPAPSPIPPATVPILDLTRTVPPPPEESPIMYGAPPSKSGSPGTYSGGPSRITLSKEEAELCRLQGLDPITYAQGKLRLAKEKKLGLRQNG
jgi:hypothetical protein